MATNGNKLAAKLDAVVRILQDIADELRPPVTEVTPELASRIDEYRRKRLCLTCSTALEGETRRGCHQSCYNTTMQRIARGDITRAKALEMGLFNPIAEKPGRKSTRPDPLYPDVEAYQKIIGKAIRDTNRDRKRSKSS